MNHNDGLAGDNAGRRWGYRGEITHDLTQRLLRKRYSKLLRKEVARTMIDRQVLDQEIHALCEALIASESRLGP